MPTTAFKARVQQETRVGTKRPPASRKISDAERRKCSRVAVVDLKKLEGMMAEVSDASGNLTMWLLRLKLSKEMLVTAEKLLHFLDEVADLEELAYDVRDTILPGIDSMINDCQDLIMEGVVEEEKWEPRETGQSKVITSLQKIVGMVFLSNTWIKTEDRFTIMHACCDLFQAVQDLVESVTDGNQYLELDEEIEVMLEEAVCKCDDQSLDEYLDVDCDNEEEEEDDEEDDGLLDGEEEDDN